VLSHVADSFLIPDNHIGRATVSSVAVAHEVQAMGARGIACLNSRDRNLLGFRRDLLTAAAYGVDRFLYVYGDKPSAGGRTSELTVRAMIEETRAAAEDPVFNGLAPFRAGVTCGLRAVPAWKATADFVFAQVSYSLESLLRWRESVQVPGPVYAGVMVLASAAMARNLAGTIPGIDIPEDLVTAVERDRNAGVRAACQQVLAIRDSGAFDGVHLVPVSRYRQVAAMLETELRPPRESWGPLPRPVHKSGRLFRGRAQTTSRGRLADVADLLVEVVLAVTVGEPPGDERDAPTAEHIGGDGRMPDRTSGHVA
jgi:5,10-methylenetetrahydrofolate reductase